MALAIYRLAGRDFNPAFADALFFDVEALFVVDFNADFVFEYGSVVVRAAGID